MIWCSILFWLLGAQLVLANVAVSGPPNAITTVDSWYDPQVEFSEIGVNVTGTFTSKVYGPDAASGTLGGMQGVGGIETLYVTGHTTPYGTVQDYFGNVLASVSNNVVTWSGARYSSYGPVPGYQPPTISDGVPLGQILGWHGMRIDPDGNYHIGARRYDPLTGRFQSADPLGHVSEHGFVFVLRWRSGQPNGPHWPLWQDGSRQSDWRERVSTSVC